MRIAYVAGFFKHVYPSLQQRYQRLLDDGAVVWIPPHGKSDEFDVNHFKSNFHSAIADGADEILICLFIMRGKDRLLEAFQAIIDKGQDRSQTTKISVKQFKSARDADGVISAIESFRPTSEPTFPNSLESLEQWVTRHHGQRIVLHPRALQGAKKSQYGDVGLIYKALNLLGTEYRGMRISTAEKALENRARFQEKLEQLELDLSSTISATRAGEQGDEYEVYYPTGTNKKRLLEDHIRKGSDRDQRFCLRIYFFWDGALKKVVIGWLPSHLDTRST